jgi:hypothetical protein
VHIVRKAAQIWEHGADSSSGSQPRRGGSWVLPARHMDLCQCRVGAWCRARL